MDGIKTDLIEIKEKLDIINEKLTDQLVRIAVVEEHSKNNRGAIAVLFSMIMSALGWFIWKLK